jgi:hypothetical protein
MQSTPPPILPGTRSSHHQPAAPSRHCRKRTRTSRYEPMTTAAIDTLAVPKRHPQFPPSAPPLQSAQSQKEHDWSTLTGDVSDGTRSVHTDRRSAEPNTHGQHGSGDPAFWVCRHRCDGAPQESTAGRWNPPWGRGKQRSPETTKTAQQSVPNHRLLTPTHMRSGSRHRVGPRLTHRPASHCAAAWSRVLLRHAGRLTGAPAERATHE